MRCEVAAGLIFQCHGVFGRAEVGLGGIVSGGERGKGASALWHEDDDKIAIESGGGAAQGCERDDVIFLGLFVALDCLGRKFEASGNRSAGQTQGLTHGPQPAVHRPRNRTQTRSDRV